jgi:pyruvate ferredoxin oxidoreductase delta subunit
MQNEVKYIEIVYRGIFQKRLAKYIAEGIVYMARASGKSALSFGRYGDSPERNGVPAKYYAAVGEVNEEDLIGYSTRVEPDYADVVIVLDDTLVKGVESWAWQGVQPINLKLREGGVMIVTSQKRAEELLPEIPSKEFNWRLAIIRSPASFSGLWAFKDDMTMEKVWGAIAKVRPDIINLEALESYLKRKDKAQERIRNAKISYEELIVREIRAGEGRNYKYTPPRLPTWQEMLEGAVIPAVPFGKRNEQFKRGTTKSERPIVDFDICIKCRLCWIYCPDEVFDETPDGYYDIAYEYCVGCGICAEVCPVKDCIVMVDENLFKEYESPYNLWKKDKQKYKEWIKELKERGKKERVFVPGLGR